MPVYARRRAVSWRSQPLPATTLPGRGCEAPKSAQIAPARGGRCSRRGSGQPADGGVGETPLEVLPGATDVVPIHVRAKVLAADGPLGRLLNLDAPLKRDSPLATHPLADGWIGQPKKTRHGVNSPHLGDSTTEGTGIKNVWFSAHKAQDTRPRQLAQ